MSRDPAAYRANYEQGRLDGRTLETAVAEARDIITKAQEKYQPVATIALVSGGRDSLLTLGVSRDLITHAAFIDTETGIPDTRTYVHDLCDRYEVPLIVETPPDRKYEDLIMQFGFPGPHAHTMMYSWLKERALRNVRRRFITEPRKQRVMYLTGVRVHESTRRMGNVKEVDRDGSVVWVAPVLHFTNNERDDLISALDLPINEVTAHLHMSGECLCGAYAKPGELEMIRFFYPEVAERIDALEEKVKAAGLPSCKWGAGRSMSTGIAGRLCSSCVGQEELAV